MQKLDKATRLELELRDSLLRPLVRPLGVLYEYLGHPLIEALSHTFLIGTKPLGFPRFIRRGFKPRFLRKEIFTLANVATLYSFFLLPQLLYLMWAFFQGAPQVRLYSLAAYWLDLRVPDLWTMIWLIGEIFLIDLIDGPLARVNKAVTALGTLLDHVRDYLTAFAALFFLIILTALSGDWVLFGGECLFLAGFGLIMGEYIKMFRSARMDADNQNRRWGDFLRSYALNKYQTPLLGRIQFWTVGSVIISGLLFYAGGVLWSAMTFPAAVAVAIAVTYHYLFTLRRQNRERA
jgi:phosphatidylglycerophosphate synthase